jgi:hypothetical protein
VGFTLNFIFILRQLLRLFDGLLGTVKSNHLLLGGSRGGQVSVSDGDILRFYAGYRQPAKFFSYAVRWYFRFPLRKGLNSRVENLHQLTRQRERTRKRFKSSRQVQRFLSIYDQIASVFTRYSNQDTVATFHSTRSQVFVPPGGHLDEREARQLRRSVRRVFCHQRWRTDRVQDVGEQWGGEDAAPVGDHVNLNPRIVRRMRVAGQPPHPDHQLCPSPRSIGSIELIMRGSVRLPRWENTAGHAISQNEDVVGDTRMRITRRRGVAISATVARTTHEVKSSSAPQQSLVVPFSGIDCPAGTETTPTYRQ